MKFKAALASFAIACLAASTSHATITLTSASGVSRADVPVAGQSSFNIYGGLASSPSSASCNGTSTCDTCHQTNGASVPLDTTFTGCNEKAINPNTNVTITFTSTVAGYPVAYDSTAVVPQTNLATNSYTSPVAAGTIATVVIPWSKICNIGSSTGGTLCNVTGSTSFSVGISSNGSQMASGSTENFPITANIITATTPYYYADDKNCTGTTGSYCYFEVYPGDSKVTVQNVSSVGTIVNSPFALRFYFEPSTASNVMDQANTNTAFSNIDLDSGSADLQLDPAGSGGFVGNGRLTGLDNNTVYVFKMAQLDKANNLGFVTSDKTSTATGAADPNTYVADRNCDTGAGASAICHIAQPGAVEGILSKSLNCFIATAAYGSAFESKVQTFRDFRDRFLLHSRLGMKFIRFYYTDFGPRAAGFIERHETLRAMSRTALFPVWVFATLSLELGFFGALLASLAILILIAATVRVCSQHLRADA